MLTKEEIHAQFMAHALGALIPHEGVSWARHERVQIAMNYADYALEVFEKRWPEEKARPPVKNQQPIVTEEFDVS